jgi:undecaprenyl diphosphate synthase
MDGNGRWAQHRGLPRIEGHRNGSKGVRLTITQTARLGVECLTLYSFSTENWKRPPEEVAGLMDLYEQYLIEERPTIMNNNIKVRHIGFEQMLPDRVLRELRETVRISQDNTGMTLCLALNYSGRSELVAAIQKMVNDSRDGSLKAEDIDETMVSSYLDTAGLPDPDLLIRTAGEMRISNFLLWQISYAELYVTDVLWPDFDGGVLHGAIKDYAGRDRRFGGLKVDAK